MNYSSFVISNKPDKFEPIKASIAPEEISYFDGTGFTSFSKLVNSCVAAAPTEIVIIMSDKVMPKQADVEKLLSLLDQGYAFVALYRLAFFGFRKELLRQIGMFDERFLSGGYEDDDFYIRLKEANLGAYISHEVEYTQSNSSWDYTKAAPHFVRKWGEIKQVGFIERKLQEENYNYNLGIPVPTTFKTWDEGQILVKKVLKFSGYPFTGV